MKRLEIADVFDLGGRLGALQKVVDRTAVPSGEAYFVLTTASGAIVKFVRDDRAFWLCKTDAGSLRAAIDTAIRGHFYKQDAPASALPAFKEGVDFDAEFPQWRLYDIKVKLETFNHVFAAECRNCETYFFPEKKLGMNVSTMLREGDTRIHESIRMLVPDAALAEMRDAGRCLALESYTASGFHALRALEIVMDDYLKMASGKDRDYKSWYDYIKALDRLAKGRAKTIVHKPSAKVVAMLDRMRQLDRNPLMHPRDSLDEMAADTLFSIALATITEMAKDIREWAGQEQLKLVGGGETQLPPPPAAIANQSA